MDQYGEGVVDRVRILVVEDDAFTAELNQRLARNLGFEVCGVAATAEEAIRLAEQARPDLVLMDLCLRGPGDGVEAADEIHRRFGIRSVFLTGETEHEIRSRAAAAEPTGFLARCFGRGASLGGVRGPAMQA